MCALMLATRKIHLEILNFDHKRHVEGGKYLKIETTLLHKKYLYFGIHIAF